MVSLQQEREIFNQKENWSYTSDISSVSLLAGGKVLLVMHDYNGTRVVELKVREAFVAERDVNIHGVLLS